MNKRQPHNLIPDPCHLSWDKLGADEVMEDGHIARMCDQCNHHVHDLTGMTDQQIMKLKTELKLQGQHLCGMLRQPCQTKSKRFSLVCIAAIAPIALVACGGNPSYQNTPQHTPQTAFPDYTPTTPTTPAPQLPQSKPRVPTGTTLFPNGVLGLVAAPKKP